MGCPRRLVAGIRTVARCLGALAALAGVSGLPFAAQAAQPWLFVNDVHLDPRSSDPAPIERWGDTNAALLRSALREMHRIAPNPPVIVMAGDFLAHHIRNADAIPTMNRVANAFGRAFPRTQFVIALGNEDSPCGDYALPPDSAFLRAAARAWGPLVDRNGAAPHFAQTFIHDGFYTASLPLRGIRVVSVDDTFWSPLYRHACDSRGDPTPGSFAELERALPPGRKERRWLIMHIPPGIDAASTTSLVHHLAIVPFLRPSPRDAVLAFIADPARRIEVVVSGHVHRFTYRLVERTDGADVPVLVSPALSPVLGNRPSFLSADVAPDGTIRGLEEHTLVAGRWRDLGGLGTLGTGEFTGPALIALQHRLLREPKLREKFSLLYGGAATYPELEAGDWRPYVCAATELRSTAFRACLAEGGLGFLTRRGVAVAGAALAAVVLVAAGAVALVVMLARRRRAPGA